MMARTPFPPGFRFHPTDVELVMYYLKRKVTGKNVGFEVISELNICKYDPWDLPDKSCLGSRDLEWYFFCPKETKYANGTRMNRATDRGYWKSTGKDRPVSYNNRTVGMVKTLVFHIGHAPKGERTDWVMHEYRMQDEELVAGGVVQDAYVLCKVFQKSGPGRRNGAQYGAPFNEDEYNNDGELIVPDALPPPALPSNNSGFLTGSTSSGPLCSSVIFPGSTSSGHLSDSAFVPGSTLSDSVFVPGSTSAGPLPDTGLSGAMPFADEVPAQGPPIPDETENVGFMLERIIPELDSPPLLCENGNNEVENFGDVNQNNGLGSSDINYIFGDLTDLDNSHWTTGLGLAGGYLELNDLSGQLCSPALDMGSQLYTPGAPDNCFPPN